jgi:glycerol-3-phosphate O-acyltransferase/dihydroxyacetone phosphate acyltransferase
MESPARRQSVSNMMPMILCHECNREFPLNEYFDHRDGLRSVAYGQRALSLLQRLTLVPLMDAVIWLLVNVFYREVIVVGGENIPDKGPVVFYGNHQNQFIDALILRSQCKRDVRFIIAEKSMTRPIVGHFARLMNSVPVTRPQDVPAAAGKGFITGINGATVTGKDTHFSKYHPGDLILLPTLEDGTSKDSGKAQVQAITSDTVLTINKPFPVNVDATTHPDGVRYLISERIDNSEMYAEVYGTLRGNNAIGIFPEGGSHDRPSLLPLKAGVALFSLGSAERGVNPTIIPFGLTYFYGHRFRSVAHIEFGKPIVASADMVKRFTSNKREVTQEFLQTLDASLRGITINAPDYDTIKFIHEFRRLFQPHNVILPAQQYLQLFRRLSKLVQSNSSHPGLMTFRENVERYMDKCNSLFLRDAQVATLKNIETRPTRRLLLRRIIMLTVIGVVLMPFAVIGLPVGFIANKMADVHAAHAKAASDVKLFGKDVKATYKMIVGFTLFPLVCLLISTCAFFLEDLHTAITVFVCIPLMMYVSLHIGRDWIMESRAAFPLFLSILSKHKQFAPLYERRQTLVMQAWSVVAELDPSLGQEIIGFATDRPTREASLFSLRHVSKGEHNGEEKAFIPKVSSLSDLATMASIVTNQT